MHPNGFWCFQGVEKEWIWKERVKQVVANSFSLYIEPILNEFFHAVYPNFQRKLR